MSASVTKESGTFVSSTDTSSIFYRQWVPTKPIGLLCIFHGMSEHSGRYDEFASSVAEDLNLQVIATDHRGHGHTACPSGVRSTDLGKFAISKSVKSVNCIEVMAMDALDLIYAKLQNFSGGGCPVFIFGHSMGSVIARWALRNASTDLLNKLNGIILSGVPTVPAVYERVPLMLLLKLFLRVGSGQDTLHNYVMGQFDTAVRKLRHDKSLPKDCMISSVREEVDKFHQDPLCGQTIDLHIWDSLRISLIKLQKVDSFFIGATRHPPILFISGTADPICNFARTGREDAARMRTLGYPVDELVLENSQHEFLVETHEIKRLGVSKTIDWLKSKM